ncbi:MAG: endonuclease/exonuclease/phosphatase family protein [Kiritimatiellia bacterium]
MEVRSVPFGKIASVLRRTWCGLLCAGGLLLPSGCQLWQMVSAEVDQAADMAAAPFRSVTVMSWNLHAGQGLDGVRDLARIAQVIVREKPDVVALQEVDRGTRRSGGVDQLAELGRLTGFRTTWCKTIDHQGGEYGIALLSRDEPLAARRIELPVAGEPRCLLLADFPRYRVGVTHLPLRAADRMACLPVLRAAIADDLPLILAGDFNAAPDSAFIEKLRLPFAIVSGFDKTYPADDPDRCIDYVAVSRRHRARFDKVAHRVVPEAVFSDHRPVVVTLR